MKEQPKQEVHYNQAVWTNPTTEPLRRTECLCLNCGLMKPGQLDNCPVAQSLYQICVRENLALVITRCPLWKPKP
jgi:hypothetical protein